MQLRRPAHPRSRRRRRSRQHAVLAICLYGLVYGTRHARNVRLVECMRTDDHALGSALVIWTKREQATWLFRQQHRQNGGAGATGGSAAAARRRPAALPFLPAASRWGSGVAITPGSDDSGQHRLRGSGIARGGIADPSTGVMGGAHGGPGRRRCPVGPSPARAGTGERPRAPPRPEAPGTPWLPRIMSWSGLGRGR